MSLFGMSDRRHFMSHVAGATAVAVPGLTFLTNLRAQAAELKKKNKSLIVLWMGGGPTTIDLWDMKPDSANAGSFKPAATKASGVSINPLLKKVGENFKSLSAIRSLTTSEGDHMRGTFLMSTGRVPNPLSEFPHIGSVLSYQMSQDTELMKTMDLPGFISVGGGRVGPGFLGMKYGAFNVGNPGSPPENVEPPRDVAERMARRAELFRVLEGLTPASGTSKNTLGLKTNVPADAVQAHKDVYQKALDLVVSSRKDVFTFNTKEQAELADRYGNNGFGRGCLLAKKLVEAGVGCVEVSLGGWDMHAQIGTALDRQLPILDGGMGSLVEDLTQSGKIKDTVIVWMGEFGRTPRINQNGGRDHFPRAWSVVVGGGNIKGGQAYGSTNMDGSEVKDNPTKIGDLFATLYAGLGLDPATQIRDNLGRPTAIAGDKATPITQLVG
ncbi:MAG: DUF1501 domain-containing protein [Fimbriiglobus sp.]